MKRIITIILLSISLTAFSQTEKDSTVLKTADTANRFVAVYVANYVRQNFKCLTLQQLEDLINLLNQLHQQSAIYLDERLKKK